MKGGGGLTKLSQRPVSGLLQLFWQEWLGKKKSTEIAAFHDSQGPQVRRGQTEMLPASEREASTPPTIVRRSTWEWLQLLFTLLLHFPCSLACGLYLTGGVGRSVLSPPYPPPPTPSELYPWRCLWGGRQDVQPTRRSKSPRRVNALAFGVTFSTPAGLTSQMLAKLGLQ